MRQKTSKPERVMIPEPPQTPRKHQNLQKGLKYDISRQDEAFHSLVTWHSKAKNPFSPALHALTPYSNFKLIRAEANPGIGFLTRMESSLISLSTEASEGQGAQGSYGCQEELSLSFGQCVPKENLARMIQQRTGFCFVSFCFSY